MYPSKSPAVSFARFLVVVCPLVTSSATGQTLPATTKAPVTYSNTLALLAIDTANVTLPMTATQSSDGPSTRLSRLLRSTIDRMNQLSDGHTAYIAVDIPYGDRQPVARMVLHKGKNAAEFLTKKTIGGLRAELDGCLIVTLKEHAPFVPGSEVPKSHAERLQRAESHVRAFPIRCLVVPPEYFTTALEQTLTKLPESLGGLPTAVLTRGLKWAAFGFDPATFKLEVTIQSVSTEDAESLADVLPTLLLNSIDLLPKHQQSWLKPLTDELLKKMRLRVQRDQILLSFPAISENTGAQLLAQVTKSLADPIQDSVTVDNLRAIQLAILNYESANACFPPSAKRRDKNGKSGLSWRVHILPFFGKDEAELYRQFHLDEPWDSEHNMKLLTRMPEVYQSSTNWFQLDERADRVIPTKTVFLAPEGEGTIFGQDEVIRIRDVKDGTSLTLTVVRVTPDQAKDWTAPDDYQFDPKNPAAGLAFDESGMGYGVACDGVVHSLKKTWREEKFLRLFQRNDGEPVRFD